MNRLTRLALSLVVATMALPVAMGQAGLGNFGALCWDPDPDFDPFSDDFGYNFLSTTLFEATMGGSGTVNWDGTNGRCFNPDITLDVAGRIGFRVGSLGSRHSGFDEGLAVTMGFPFPGGNWSTASITKDGTQATYFGADGLSLFFAGASDRYILAETTSDDVFMRCRLDLVGDAARVQYTLRNLEADPVSIGMWYGQWVEMMSRSGQLAGAFSVNGPYVVMPGRKPLILEERINRLANPAAFPNYINFNFSQANAYGLQVLLGPSETTLDETGQSDATQSDEVRYGNGGFVLGGLGANPPFVDADPIDVTVGRPSYVVKYPGILLAQNEERTVTQYFKSTWSYANYARPYAVVLDAPKILRADSNGVNGLSPNPFFIRVYVDNIRGYSTVNQEFPLNEVKVNLTFPKESGLSLASGQPSTVIIDRVNPRQIRFVDFRVQANGKTVGPQSYTVKVTPTPGPVKTVVGQLVISGTPRLLLKPKANLITIPYRFADTSLQTVLGLKAPTQFQAFAFSPQSGGYILQTNVQRGKAYWVVYNSTTEREIALAGNPTQPTDLTTGAPNIVLKSGWNLIGNPYNYVIPLGQIVGVSGANSQNALPWADLVQQGIVGGSLAYYDNSTATPTYKYLEGVDAGMVPGVGYWLYVNTSEDLALSFPPVYQEGIGGTGTEKARARERITEVRYPKPVFNLRLIASQGADQEESVLGQVREQNQIDLVQRAKAPKSPVQNLYAALTERYGKKTVDLQRAYKAPGTQTFRYTVESVSGGLVRITWPNVGLVPNNLKVTIYDPATKVERNLRQFPAFAYNAAKGSKKTFEIRLTLQVK